VIGVVEDLVAHQLAGANREQPGQRLGQIDAAPAPAGVNLSQAENSAFVHLPPLPRPKLPDLELIIDVGQPLAEPLVATVRGAASRGKRSVQLDLGIDRPEIDLSVPGVPSRERVFDQFQIVDGHRFGHATEGYVVLSPSRGPAGRRLPPPPPAPRDPPAPARPPASRPPPRTRET